MYCCGLFAAARKSRMAMTPLACPRHRDEPDAGFHGEDDRPRCESDLLERAGASECADVTGRVAIDDPRP
ncbi:hypothetical protein B1810_10230 [Panacagrimonas perspica]|nr:hypothetical protein B1810_10230 [Panacagrimonas perspica]